MAKINNIDGIAKEDYMYSHYKDVQFELYYLSRIVKHLKHRIKNLKNQKEVYDNIIKDSVHHNTIFDEDIIDFSDKALDVIAIIAEDYFDKNHSKVTKLKKGSVKDE